MGEQSARARRIPAGQRSAFSVQHSAFSTALPIPAPPRPSSLAPQYSALSTQHSVLSTRSSTLAPRPSALSTQYSVLATPPPPPGLTLPETLIATFLLALLLFVTAQGVEHVRNQLKTARTWEVLARLDEALLAYHAATRAWPETPGFDLAGGEGKGGDKGTRRQEDKGRPDRGIGEADSMDEEPKTQDQEPGTKDHEVKTAEWVVTALRAVPASRAILEHIEATAPASPSRGPLRDAWGVPLRCLTSASPSSADRQAVVAHGGRPIFISVGPNPEIGLRTDGMPR